MVFSHYSTPVSINALTDNFLENSSNPNQPMNISFDFSEYKTPLKVSEIPFNLQMFAGEKTEEATDKRKRDAVKEGNIAKSQDLGSVAILLAGFFMLNVYGKTMFTQCADYMKHSYINSIHTEFAFEECIILFHQFVAITMIVILPFMLAIMLAAVVVNLIQTGGFLFRFDPMMPNLDRLNPISGFQNMFSWKMVAELVKSIFKILIVAYIPYATVTDNFGQFIRYIALDPLPSFGMCLELCYSMAMKILIILLVLAIGDYIFQKWRHAENLKMSKEDIKEEFKQQEGDPHVKQKIKERQRQASTRRQMEEVPKATVVVTNPTHIAVALKYEPGQKGAPVVVAMGAGLIAQKIKEIARENGVPIVENKPLARQMYKSLEVGDEIPAELYQAVVEILAQVFRDRKRKAA